MLSIGSTVGRFALSTVADYTGPLNVWTLTQTVCTIMFLMLPLCQNLGSLIAFGIVYGLVTGGFVSLYPLCISIIMGNDKLAEKVSLRAAGEGA
jgi:MFS family permease